MSLQLEVSHKALGDERYSNRYTKQLLFICEELVSYDPFIKVKNKTLCLCGAYMCLRHKKKKKKEKCMTVYWDGLNPHCLHLVCKSGKPAF